MEKGKGLLILGLRHYVPTLLWVLSHLILTVTLRSKDYPLCSLTEENGAHVEAVMQTHSFDCCSVSRQESYKEGRAGTEI